MKSQQAGREAVMNRAGPQRVADRVVEGQPGHGLVRDLGVDADQLGPVERGDEVQRVPQTH